MARPSARLMVNRAAMSKVRTAVADGVLEVARTIVEEAPAPDETPFGVGLVDRGGWAVFDGNKKVAGGSLDGTQPSKPRSLRTVPNGITGIAGFGFPAKFQEQGTVNQPPRPFLWPTAVRVKGVAGAIIREIVGPALR